MTKKEMLEEEAETWKKLKEMNFGHRHTRIEGNKIINVDVNKLKIKRQNLEIYEGSRRDNFDKRKKFASAVFSYIAPNGDEYRRRYNAPVGTPEHDFWEIAPTEIEIFI